MVCVTLVVKEPITGCETDTDCPEGYRCEAGVCIPIQPIPWEWVAGIGLGVVVIGGVAYYISKKGGKKHERKKQ